MKGVVMTCKLVLTKTKMYNLIKLFANDIPSRKLCNFSSHGSVYWMDYICLEGKSVRVIVATVFGITKIRFIDRKKRKEVSSYTLEQDFLRKEGILRPLPEASVPGERDKRTVPGASQAGFKT